MDVRLVAFDSSFTVALQLHSVLNSVVSWKVSAAREKRSSCMVTEKILDAHSRILQRNVILSGIEKVVELYKLKVRCPWSVSSILLFIH